VDALDAAGGTDIFQMAPGRVKLTTGTDARPLSERPSTPSIETIEKIDSTIAGRGIYCLHQLKTGVHDERRDCS
jgi:hypothetical protein